MSTSRTAMRSRTMWSSTWRTSARSQTWWRSTGRRETMWSGTRKEATAKQQLNTERNFSAMKYRPRGQKRKPSQPQTLSSPTYPLSLCSSWWLSWTIYTSYILQHPNIKIQKKNMSFKWANLSQYCQATGLGKWELNGTPSPRRWQYNLMGHPPKKIDQS